MKIESIVITNFRQFNDEQSMNFSIDPEKNVTVIHGANGSGKTSLLNAFKWCFYGQTDFDTLNDNILNEAAIQDTRDGGFLDIRIAVKFNHENKVYTAIRKQTFQKLSGLKASAYADSEFSLDVRGEDGQTIRSESPFKTLQAILPQDLQPYFFFNGERIEHLAGVNQSVQVQDAIRKLMGLELVDRAAHHLVKVKNNYRRLVKEEVSEEQKELHDLIEKYETDIVHYKEDFVDAKRREGVAKAALNDIERELKQFEKSRDLQETRNSLDQQIINNNREIAKIKSKQKQLINNDGFLVISENMFQNCDDLVEDCRRKGVLPYGIKDQFIDDLIEIGTCICGSKVERGSKEHECLKDVRKTSGSNELESAYTMVASLLKNHQEEVDRFKYTYKEEASSLSSYIQSNAKLRHQLNEVSSQLIQVDDKRIAELENSHQAELVKSDNARNDKCILQRDLEDAQSKLSSKKDELLRSEDRLSMQNIAKSRLEKAEHMTDTLNNLREALSDQVREDLSKKVDETFQSIIRKPVRAIIDEEYRLQVLKTTIDGEEYLVSEQSTGERQVTSLSFISSIIALAKERHAQKTQFFQGGLYPLVMDSPFGALDDDYRAKVAEGVSELAEQVIMFVSNSQWAGRVKQACENKVGKSYQLVYHSPKLDKSAEDEYTKASENRFEYSTFKEV